MQGILVAITITITSQVFFIIISQGFFILKESGFSPLRISKLRRQAKGVILLECELLFSSLSRPHCAHTHSQLQYFRSLPTGVAWAI